MIYAIAGVSGHTGRAAAEALIEAGKSVRVIVRNPEKGEAWKAKGAQVAVADLCEPTSLAGALAGAAGAYLLIPPNMAAPNFREYQHRLTDALVEAITRSAVPHVVFLSSIGAQHPSGTGPIAALHRAEAALLALEKTRLSILRAADFMENLEGLLGTLGQGVLPSFLPAGLPFDMVASVDIGRLAARLLVETANKNEIVELGGPARSMNDVAAAISVVLGTPVRLQELPTDTMVPTLTGFGFPHEVAELFREMNDAMIRRQVIFEGSHRRVQGATSLEEFMRGLLATKR